MVFSRLRPSERKPAKLDHPEPPTTETEKPHRPESPASGGPPTTGEEEEEEEEGEDGEEDGEEEEEEEEERDPEPPVAEEDDPPHPEQLGSNLPSLQMSQTPENDTQNLTDLCGRSPVEFHKYCQNLLESQKLVQHTHIESGGVRSPEEESLFRLLDKDRERLQERIAECRGVLQAVLPHKSQTVHFFRALYPKHPNLKTSEQQLQLLNSLLDQLR
jgi:hypothetical protein